MIACRHRHQPQTPILAHSVSPTTVAIVDEFPALRLVITLRDLAAINDLNWRLFVSIRFGQNFLPFMHECVSILELVYFQSRVVVYHDVGMSEKQTAE